MQLIAGDRQVPSSHNDEDKVAEIEVPVLLNTAVFESVLIAGRVIQDTLKDSGVQLFSDHSGHEIQGMRLVPIHSGQIARRLDCATYALVGY